MWQLENKTNQYISARVITYIQYIVSIFFEVRREYHYYFQLA